MRFAAQTKLRIRGELVEPGTVLTLGQLNDRNYDAMLRRGEIALLPEADGANEEVEVEAEAGAPDTEPPPPRDFSGLTVYEIRDGLADGTFDPDEVLAAEMQRPDPRKGVLEALGVDPEGEET